MNTNRTTRTVKRYGKSNVFVMTGMQEKILRNLASYKFLTVSQLIWLKAGIKNRLYENIKKLVSGGYVKFADYRTFLRNGGKVERIHFLTPKGATLLVENTPNLHYDDIRYPKSSTTLFTHDYFHRVSSINTQISFDKWITAHDMHLHNFDTYFDVVGSRIKHLTNPMKAITRIDFGNGHFLDPDGIALYEQQGEKKILLFETYNGKDTKRVMQQLRKHSYVIKQGLAAYKYQCEAVTKVCSTFETQNAMNAVLKRLETDPYFHYEGIENYFFFGVANKVWENFETSFVDLKGKERLMSEM